MAENGPKPAVEKVQAAITEHGLDRRVIELPVHARTSEQAADALGVTVGQIVKSLVFVAGGEDGERIPIVCLVSGANRVDLERLAAVVGRRDVRRATAKEAYDLTGFTIGGIPPFPHSSRTRVIMDPDLGRYEKVWAAAGLPTVVFPVAPAILRMLADAHVAPIAEVPPVERAS